MKPLYDGTIKVNGIKLYPIDYYIWEIIDNENKRGGKIGEAYLKWRSPSMNMNAIRASIKRLKKAGELR